MRPVLTEDKKLGVVLHKVDESRLKKARMVGKMLDVLHQDEGVALVDAVDAILLKFSPTTEEEPGE